MDLLITIFFVAFVFTLSPHFSLGLSSPLWDLSSWADQQRQPPSRQPVSHHHNNRHFGHPLLGGGRPCVHLPAGLAQHCLQHCGWSHFHLHTCHQLHAVCASGKEKRLKIHIQDASDKKLKEFIVASFGESAGFLLYPLTSPCFW